MQYYVGNIDVHDSQRVDFAGFEPMIKKSVSIIFKHLPYQKYTHDVPFSLASRYPDLQ